MKTALKSVLVRLAYLGLLPWSWVEGLIRRLGLEAT